MIESQIDGEFSGWTGETVFKLKNGQFWQQARYAYRYHYAYNPRVRVLREGSRHVLWVDGLSEGVEVRRADVIESYVNGAFRGWDGKTVIKLANGQVWKQSVYHYEYFYAYMPTVYLYQGSGGYLMQVESASEAVPVHQVR